MKHITLFSILFFYFSIAQAEALTASLDRDSLSLNETAQLTLTYDGKKTDQRPNLTALRKDFDILGTGHSTQHHSYNGKTTSITKWTVNLKPKEEGTFTIPAFKLSHLQSQPLTLTVTPASLPDTTGSDDIFLEASITPSTPYIQSQLTYLLKIFLKRNIQSPQLTEPTANNATIMALGEDKNYTKIIRNETYQVLERRYVIIPQESGELTVTSPVLSGAILKTDTVDQGPRQFFSSKWEPIRIGAKNITTSVKSIPSTWKAPWWLPAKTLTISEQWSGNLNQLALGQPVTRTITLEAVGLTAEQLPQIKAPSLTQANVYVDKPTLETKTNGRDLIAKRVEKFAIVAKQSGSITLPEINIPWWDINTQKIHTATLPQYNLMFTGTISHTENNTSALPQKIVEKTVGTASSKLSTPKNRFWIALAGLFFILWIATLFFKRPKTTKNIAPETQASPNLKHWIKLLKTACLNNDLLKTREYLIQYFREKFPERSINNLSDIEALTEHQKFQQECRTLTRLLYREDNTPWEGRNFFTSFKDAIKSIQKKSSNTESLTKLYPEGDY